MRPASGSTSIASMTRSRLPLIAASTVSSCDSETLRRVSASTGGSTARSRPCTTDPAEDLELHAVEVEQLRLGPVTALGHGFMPDHLGEVERDRLFTHFVFALEHAGQHREAVDALDVATRDDREMVDPADLQLHL